MIVAGDFNTWNKKRMQKLHEIREKLGLNMVKFSETSAVKVFMGKQLDFIFYRGLELMDSKVVANHGLSDHNPLFATFKKL
jgi:endonuclease/exonuclease/phosphatase (EEP) superfamily protein YafD